MINKVCLSTCLSVRIALDLRHFYSVYGYGYQYLDPILPYKFNARRLTFGKHNNYHHPNDC